MLESKDVPVTDTLYMWVHHSCAMWMPGPTVTPKTPVRMIRLDYQKFNIGCVICGQKGIEVGAVPRPPSSPDSPTPSPRSHGGGRIAELDAPSVRRTCACSDGVEFSSYLGNVVYPHMLNMGGHRSLRALTSSLSRACRSKSASGGEPSRACT